MATVVTATTGTAVAEALLPSPYAVRLIPVAVVVAIESAVATFAVAATVATADLAPVALAVATEDCRLINAVAMLLLVVELRCCLATSVGTVALATLFVEAACDSLSFGTWRVFAENKQIENHFRIYFLAELFYNNIFWWSLTISHSRNEIWWKEAFWLAERRNHMTTLEISSLLLKTLLF